MFPYARHGSDLTAMESEVHGPQLPFAYSRFF